MYAPIYALIFQLLVKKLNHERFKIICFGRKIYLLEIFMTGTTAIADEL